MWGRGRFSLYNCFLFSSRSILLLSFVLTSMVSLVTGKTHNVFLKLSDAVSNVFYHSQCYSYHKTTLGSLKIVMTLRSNSGCNTQVKTRG